MGWIVGRMSANDAVDGSCREVRHPDNLRLARIRSGWWAHELWHRFAVVLSPSRDLCGSHLPVVQPTKLYMAVNAKIAKSLGVEVPPRLLGLADEVIE